MLVASIGLLVPPITAFILASTAALSGRFRGAWVLGGLALVLYLFRHHLGLAGYWLALVLAVYGAWWLVRFIRAPTAAKRNQLLAIRARLRWRWLCRNLGLAWQDRHIRDKVRKTAMVPVLRHFQGLSKMEGRHLVRYPRARFRADAHGIVGSVRTIPGSGRKEFEAQAEHIANAWRCERVHVSQKAPGRLVVRGLVNDPLVAPFGLLGAPAGTYSQGLTVRPYIGRDEWGTDRHIDLSGVTGISVAGLPGYGKTSFVLSLLMQLAGSAAVQFNFIDGKGGGDYSDWSGRAWQFCDDNLRQAVAVLEDTHALMRKRLSEAGQSAPRNAWRDGPTERTPLIVTVIDECHTFFDVDAVKGDRTADPLVRAARALTGQLVRKGRSVLFLTILITQKQTSDAIPTAIRDNCRLGFSFAVKTKEAAVAALGEAIREYPSYCPSGLRDPKYVGVATASMSSGADPFVRLRVPEVTEEAAAERARATEQYRRDPSIPLVGTFGQSVADDLDYVPVGAG